MRSSGLSWLNRSRERGVAGGDQGRRMVPSNGSTDTGWGLAARRAVLDRPRREAKPPRVSFAVRMGLAAGVGAMAGIWVGVLVVTPYLVAHHRSWSPGQLVAGAAYVVGGIVCHQQVDRSFHPWERPLPVCARCAGLYAAAPFGIVGGFVRRQSSRRGRRDRAFRQPLSTLRAVLLVAAIPTLAMVAAEMVGVAEPSNVVRAVSALPLGCVVAWVVSLSLVGRVEEGA